MKIYDKTEDSSFFESSITKEGEFFIDIQGSDWVDVFEYSGITNTNLTWRLDKEQAATLVKELQEFIKT